MGRYFGTDGFRGEANVGLTAEHAFKVGRYIGWYFGKGKEHAEVVIGKDTRRSSYMLEYALVAGLNASGANVSLMHVTTTPSVAYITRTDNFDCGIMISASHNPYYDNGIKLINSLGHKMDAKVEELIEDYIDGNVEELPLATKEQIGKATDYSVGRNGYIGYLMSVPTRSFKNYKIGLDCANGASSAIAKSVFDALGAKTYVINADPNGLNINNNCGSTHIEQLQALVKEENLDIAFAYDGDADRCLGVDSLGRVIDGDQIIYICGKYLKDHNQLEGNKVVTTIMSNIGLYKALDELEIGYEKTNVGDKYVNENMVKNGYVLGGEQSGHIIFSKYATTGDGILTSLKVMEAIIESKRPVEDLLKPLKIYPQLLRNLKAKDKETVLNNEKVKEVIKKVEKELGTDGRVLVRPSGTEPLIRVMVEASTDEICAKHVEEIIKVMETC